MLFGVIAASSGDPKPYPILNRHQKRLYESAIDKDITVSEIKKKIESEKEGWYKTFDEDEFVRLVKEHNDSNKKYRIKYKMNEVDDLEELKRIYMLLKFNEVKGSDSNLCSGLKKWFTEVGLLTRFV